MNPGNDGVGWFYRKDGKTFGPISTNELRGFLRSGQMLPGQAVWQQLSQGSLFVHAETAAFAAQSSCRQPAIGWTPAADSQ